MAHIWETADARAASKDDESQHYAMACSECQRRKQKCNRLWPCDRCQKRKIAEKCRFPSDQPLGDSWNPTTVVLQTRKRGLNLGGSDGADTNLPDDGDGLEAIGYGAHHLLANLGAAVESKNTSSAMPEQYSLHPKTSAPLQRALDTLPDRSHIDLLLQNFLDSVNFYYYIVYPPKFLAEYHQWWFDRTADHQLGLPWTCLLIMVCACSAQHATVELAEKLEADLGTNIRQLAQLYHDAARELHSVIPLDQSHIHTVQYLLHSCYWFKAEAKFVECWNRLGAAIREGQMLGLHQDSSTLTLSEFDTEMSRRLWCILDAWDWLVSALLQRPMLIDRTDCTAKQPGLGIEGYPTSPLLHIRLQSILVTRIFKRFGPPKNIQTMDDIQDYVQILESWMATFPPEFYFNDPDVSNETEYPWIALHRHYLHTTALSMALGPLRAFMAKRMPIHSTPAIELQFRADGVNRALDLMKAVHAFLDYVWERDTTFHFVPFCIFDTAALLCSSLLHDDDGTISRKRDILDSIEQGLASLKRLSTATNTAKTPYDILRRLSAKVNPAMAAKHQALDERRKRHRVEQAQALPTPQQLPVATNSYGFAVQPAQADQYVDLDRSHNGTHLLSKPTSPPSHSKGVTAASSSSSRGDLTDPVTLFRGATSSGTGSNPEPLAEFVEGIDQGQEAFAATAGAQSALPPPQTLTADPWQQAYTAPGPWQQVYTAPDPWQQFYTAPDPWQQDYTAPDLTTNSPPNGVAASLEMDPSTHGNTTQSSSSTLDGAATAASTQAPGTSFAALPEAAHLGDLAVLWNWQSLDLDFTENPMLSARY